MLKRVGYSIVILISVLTVIFITSEDEENKQNDNTELEQPPLPEEGHIESNSDKKINPETLINEIFAISKEGKLKHVPYTLGQTKIKGVTDKWGEPKQTTNTERGYYANYPIHKATIGYRGNNVFDIRSFHPQLQYIHLEDIKKAKGNPDDIRYYKDKKHDQVILVYFVNSNYHLKWILPKPTDREPNPNVHHVSVISQTTDKDDSQTAVSKVVKKMSLNEKIGQMIVAGITGTTLDAQTKTLINQYNVGGFIFYANNLETPKQTVQLLKQMKAENVKNRLPLLLSIDQEGGRISRLPGDLINLPTNKKIGTINNDQFSYEVGALLGKELKAFGFNLNFAPVLDVNSNPNNPVIGDRSFGNNPEVVSNLGIQTMKGIYSQGIIPVIKHFPGHGDTSVDSHLKLPKVNKSLEELKKLELIPFNRAIQNGADVVMVAHMLLPKLDPKFPATMSKEIITGILREQLSFNGVIITDDMTMKAITNNYDIGQAAVQSIKAGSDIILVAHGFDQIVSVVDAIKTAVEQGKITEQRINTSVSRIVQLKREYKIKLKKVQGVDIEKLNEEIEKVLRAYTR